VTTRPLEARPIGCQPRSGNILRRAPATEGAIVDSEQDVDGYPVHAVTSEAFKPDDWDLDNMTCLDAD
jgi:hypothetical protein